LVREASDRLQFRASAELERRRRAVFRRTVEAPPADRWYDPRWFAESFLRHDLWHMQRRILEALAQPRARVAVKASHASSKTFTGAEAVLWAPNAGGIAITTAPTARQVRRLIWQEVNAMATRPARPLPGRVLQVEYQVSPECYSLGLSTDAGVNFQGFHARPSGFLLIVMDEAPGVSPEVFAAVEGVRAGGDVRVLMLGNPDVPSGPFYDVFEKDRAGWTCLTIDAFDTPNFTMTAEDAEALGVPATRASRQLTLDELLALPDERLDYAPRPYLVTRRWVREKHDEWGPDSPLWQSKVRGQFPDQSEDSLISLRWIEAANRRADELATATDDGETDREWASEWEAGIDVAGPGEDETVVAVRCGPRVVAFRGWSLPEPRGEVLAFLAPYQERLRAVKVDSVGQGYYFARHLEDQGYRGRIKDVNVGAAATNTERYANLKAEAYWGLRLRFQQEGIIGPLPEKAMSQLASIRYQHNARGQVVIERKEDARKRGVKSPDYAEALMLAFAAPRSREVRLLA